MIDPRQLTNAVWAGDLATVEELLATGADPNATDGERPAPLHLAIEQQWVPIVRRLLAAGAAVNLDPGDGWTPLAHAIDITSDVAHQAGLAPHEVSTELIELLLFAGAEPNERAFGLAVGYGNRTILTLLRRYIESAPPRAPQSRPNAFG